MPGNFKSDSRANFAAIVDCSQQVSKLHITRDHGPCSRTVMDVFTGHQDGLFTAELKKHCRTFSNKTEISNVMKM